MTMIASFIATYGLDRDETGFMAERLSPGNQKPQPVELAPALYFAGTTTGGAIVENNWLFTEGNTTFVYIGQVLNLDVIRKTERARGSLAEGISDAGLLYQLYQRSGSAFLTLLEGRFIFLIIHENRITCLKDPMGSLQLYYTAQAGAFVLTTEIKTLTGSRFPLSISRERFLPRDEMTISSMFRDIKSLEMVSTLKIGGDKPGILMSVSYNIDPLQGLSFETRKEAGNYFVELLRQSVEHSLASTDRVCIPVSGGVDSGAVAALAARKASKIYTFSIGTEYSNEFEGARELANLIGSEHTELMLDQDDLLLGILQNLYYNEVVDPLCLEILAPFDLLFRKARDHDAHMITGYGADLLLGGTLLNEHPQNINEISKRLVGKAARSGEYNPFLAMKHGISISHPYWTIALMAHALDMPGHWKNHHEQVKYFFREAVQLQGLLPEPIAWRPKLGIHEGSMISTMVTAYMQEQFGKAQPEDKYQVYTEMARLLFAEGIPLEELDLSFYLKKKLTG
jgi:asparagine synthetase B (glutamine-hydrolysing)